MALGSVGSQAKQYTAYRIISLEDHAWNPIQGMNGVRWLENHHSELSRILAESTESKSQSHTSLSLYHCTYYTQAMSATIRSLRPLMRTATPAMRRLPTLAAHARTYKQPARDLMTGEVTQLPDIDVSCLSCHVAGSWRTAHNRQSRDSTFSQAKASSLQIDIWSDIYRSHVDHPLEQ